MHVCFLIGTKAWEGSGISQEREELLRLLILVFHARIRYVAEDCVTHKDGVSEVVACGGVVLLFVSYRQASSANCS